MSGIASFKDIPWSLPANGGGEPAPGEPWLTPEGIDVKTLYSEADLAGIDFLDTFPGIAPFLRGPYPTMYVDSRGHPPVCRFLYR
jgi:methylmalonyl-CoA mutase